MKIAVIGAAGGIGSSVAYSTVLNGTADELVLVDRRVDELRTHVWDLELLRTSARRFRIGTGEISDAVDADVVVFAAAAPQRKDVPRIAYLAENLAIADELCETLSAASDWPGVLVVASNPVDPLVTALRRRTGIDRFRVLGYNLNDSLRLRYGVAEALGVEPHRVSGWVLGEHGEHCVPLLDHVTVDGVPVNLDEERRQAVRDFMFGWYPRWVALDVSRSSTWVSGNGIAAMVRAIAADTREVWPSSVVLDGEYGITGTAVGVPVLLGRGGATEVLEWPLAADTRQALVDSASYVDKALTQVEA